MASVPTYQLPMGSTKAILTARDLLLARFKLGTSKTCPIQSNRAENYVHHIQRPQARVLGPREIRRCSSLCLLPYFISCEASRCSSSPVGARYDKLPNHEGITARYLPIAILSLPIQGRSSIEDPLPRSGPDSPTDPATGGVSIHERPSSRPGRCKQACFLFELTKRAPGPHLHPPMKPDLNTYPRRPHSRSRCRLVVLGRRSKVVSLGTSASVNALP